MPLIINNIFGLLGYAIGSHPILCIFLSLSLFCISLFGPLLRLDIKIDIQSGFGTADMASIQEVKAHKLFFNNTGEPWYMAIFATSNSDSMLDAQKSDELTTFHKYITQIMPINVNKSTVHYESDLCEPFCNFNSQLWNLLNYQSFFKIFYPLSMAGPYRVNVGKYLFNRTVDERGTVISVGTVAVYFTTFITDPIKRQQLVVFEEQVLREIHNHNTNPNSTISLILHGGHTVNSEIRRGVQLVLPYYFTGAILLILFVVVGLFLTAVCYSYPVRCLQLILPLAAVISPTLAAISATGLVLLAGFHINVLILISPFLTLATGIGVDDAFLLTNTWLRSTAVPDALTTPERLQLVLENVGIGITVTSLTNFLGFALGCFFPAPEIQLFCATVALSMLLDLLFQLFFYAPLQVLFAYDEAVAYKQIKMNKLDLLDGMKENLASFCKYYSQFITSFWAELIAVVLLIVYFYVAISGIRALDTNVDGKMLLPPNSQSVEGIRIMNELVWPDYLSINYIVRNPPNFSDPTEYRNFTLMVKEMEAAENSLGSSATMYWVKDYLRYLANPDASKLDVIFGIYGREGNETTFMQSGLDLSQFDFFINTDPYTAWKVGTHYKRDPQNRVVITSMLLIMAYNGTKSLSDKAKLLRSCREMCTRYSQYDMIPFDTDAGLVDIILSVPSITITTILFTFCAISLVCFVFSLNIVTSVFALLSVVSISAGVVGFLHHWHCFLDPVLMIAILMTTGLSIDYTVHIIFHYMLSDCTDNIQRISASFTTCALSMLQAGLSTFLIMFPVLFAPVGVYAVIAKAVILTVIFGLLHGLFILPVLLTILPSCFNQSWLVRP